MKGVWARVGGGGCIVYFFCVPRVGGSWRAKGRGGGGKGRGKASLTAICATDDESVITSENSQPPEGKGHKAKRGKKRRS